MTIVSSQCTDASNPWTNYLKEWSQHFRCFGPYCLSWLIFFAKKKIVWKKRYDVWLLSFELGPNWNSICATTPGPEQYLCYNARTRTVSVLQRPDPNSNCVTRPGPEQYLCYNARTRRVSVLPDGYRWLCTLCCGYQSTKPLARPAWQHNLLRVTLFFRAN
jgi:hypothetical protein